MAKALRLATEAQPAQWERITGLATRLREALTDIPDIQLNSPADGSPYIVNASVEGVRPETLLHGLSNQEIYVSTVSACSSKTSEASHVILAMTHSELRARNTIRISLAPHTTSHDIEQFLTTFKTLVTQLR